MSYGKADRLEFCGEREVLKSGLSVEHALARVGPDVGHVDDGVEPAGDAVVGCHDEGLCGDGSDVSVDALETPLPVVVPAVVAVERAGAEGFVGEHNAVVDGLGVERLAERHEKGEADGGEDFSVRFASGCADEGDHGLSPYRWRRCTDGTM